MFYYFNCVVLLLLFVVWLFVSVIGVNAATPRGIKHVVCVANLSSYVMRTNRFLVCVAIRRSIGSQDSFSQ